MRFALGLCCVLMLAGCRKKSAPEFYKLEGQHSILVAREGEDAYLSAEMDAIVAGLQVIPPDALERPRADALLATINSTRDRLRAEQAPKPKQPAVDPFAGRFSPPTETEAPPPPTEAEGVDAGPPQPYAGMPLDKFKALFGTCFAEGPAGVTQDGGAATSQVLGASGDCQKRFGVPGSTSTQYLFTEKGLWGKRSESVVVVDAGVVKVPAPRPPPPEPVDAGPPALIFLGAPRPDVAPAPAPATP